MALRTECFGLMNGKKIVVITGVTHGLGRAMAEEFARLGNTVVGCGRSQKEIAQLCTQLAKPHEFAVVDVNVKGTVSVIRHFMPAMIKRGEGVVVNFSSGWGRSTDAEVAPYCASKWAIEGLTQALAQELPSSMAAIPLNPGIINTEMLQSSFGGSAAAYPAAEEWAKIAAPFLLQLGPSDNGKQL